MVFIKFQTNVDDTELFFVGSDVESILKDTDNGTEFGSYKLQSYETITEAEAREACPQYIDIGIIDVINGRCKSFML